MIKLKSPLNYKGVIYEKGSKIALESDLEERLIENGNAEKYPKDKPVSEEVNEVQSNDTEEAQNA